MVQVSRGEVTTGQPWPCSWYLLYVYLLLLQLGGTLETSLPVREARLKVRDS